MNRDASVVITLEQVINDWFSRVANGSILKAIQHFGLGKVEENVRQLLFVLFRCQNYLLENDYQPDNLSEANTFLWLSYLEYVKQHRSVSTTQIIILNVPVFYIITRLKNLKKQRKDIYLPFINFAKYSLRIS
jgi:hypothetical protein